MGAQLSSLPSAIKRAYPAATGSGSVVEEAAVLDVAFDHLLYGLHERGLYEVLGLTLIGGTALRKYRLGHRSRFSFDLDRGALSWEVHQEIAEIKASYRNDKSHGRDHGGYPSLGW